MTRRTRCLSLFFSHARAATGRGTYDPASTSDAAIQRHCNHIPTRHARQWSLLAGGNEPAAFFSGGGRSTFPHTHGFSLFRPSSRKDVTTRATSLRACFRSAMWARPEATAHAPARRRERRGRRDRLPVGPFCVGTLSRLPIRQSGAWPRGALRFFRGARGNPRPVTAFSIVRGVAARLGTD